MSNVVVDNVQQDLNGLTHVRQLYPDGLTILDDGTGRITAYAATARTALDEFTPDDGQIIFSLEESPVGRVLMYINGALQIEGRDFSVVGSTVTWLDVGFQLSDTDSVAFIYPW